MPGCVRSSERRKAARRYFAGFSRAAASSAKVGRARAQADVVHAILFLRIVL
jgi:hypothetical protein